MTTKLTLTINDAVIVNAKKYAKSKGKSLSDLVENYLKSLTGKDKSKKTISHKVLALMGQLDLPKDFDYKKERNKALLNKYK
ncbi:MAG: DUF6364 family protein [Bacteroidota bacterium]